LAGGVLLPGATDDLQPERSRLQDLQVTCDGWQGVDSIQILSKGIEADTLSVDRDTAAYDTSQELIYEGRLDGYFHPLLIEGLLQLSMA